MGTRTEMSDTASAYSRIASGAIVVFLGHILGMGLGFGTRILSARLLTPSGYGALILGVTIMTLLALVGQLGLRQGVPRYIPIDENPSTVSVTAFQLVLVSSITLVGGAILLSERIARSLADPEFQPLIVVFIAAVPFFAILEIAVGIFRGVEDALTKGLVYNFFHRFSILVLLLVGVFSGHGPLGAAIGWTSAVAVTAIIAIIAIKKTTDILPERAQWCAIDAGKAHELVTFSVPLMAASSIWQLMQQVDTLFIGHFLTTATVGMYDAAFVLSRLILVALWAFGFLLLPVFSELGAQQSHEEMKTVYKLITKWMVLVTVPGFVFLIGFSDTLLASIFGIEYETATGPLIVLSTAFFLHIVAGPNKEALIAIGETRYILRANLVILILNLSLNLTLIPTIGIIGAAIATGGAYTCMNLLVSYRLYSLTGIHPFSRAVTSPFLIAGVLFVLVEFGTRSVEPTIPTLIAGLILFQGVTAVAYVVGGGLEAEDIELLDRLDDRLSIELDGVIRLARRFKS